MDGPGVTSDFSSKGKNRGSDHKAESFGVFFNLFFSSFFQPDFLSLTEESLRSAALLRAVWSHQLTGVYSAGRIQTGGSGECSSR